MSFLGVILSCWTYVTFLEEFVNRRVTVFFPYGAIAATLASYILFSCAYLVRKTRNRQESALLRQSWQYWKNKHNSVTFLV